MAESKEWPNFNVGTVLWAYGSDESWVRGEFVEVVGHTDDGDLMVKKRKHEKKKKSSPDWSSYLVLMDITGTDDRFITPSETIVAKKEGGNRRWVRHYTYCVNVEHDVTIWYSIGDQSVYHPNETYWINIPGWSSH